jgi:hypothetical protein
MNHLAMQGLGRRRILVNYRVDPDVMQRLLPAPFRPKLLGEWAMAGICLLRLEQLRPRGLPAVLGVSSENAAHRFAVTWLDANGEEREGVYIPRRDTGSIFNHVMGGRIFPGEQQKARIRAHDTLSVIDFRMETHDGGGDVFLRARRGERIAATSHFPSLKAASQFFVAGAVGYSVTSDAERLDGLRLKMHTWKLETLDIDELASSYYEDVSRFPKGTVEYDCTLVMRDIRHEWEHEEQPSASVGGCLA